jgi:hypothetical protein
MVIERNKPWILWPDNVSYGINKGNIGQTFEGENNFSLVMKLKLLSKDTVKRTIFAKVPNYCGIDIEPNNKPLLILRINREGEEISEYLTSQISINEDFNYIIFRYNRDEKLIEVLLNELVIISYTLKENETLTKESNPHIIFGAGNFPINNFNMNLCSYDLDFLMISKSYLTFEEIIDIKENKTIKSEIIGLYDFEKLTDFKVFDLTNNCNFLHKII